MSDGTEVGLPCLLMQAARSAAVADGLIPSSSTPQPSSSPTPEPEPKRSETESRKAKSTENTFKSANEAAAAALAMVAASSKNNNTSMTQQHARGPSSGAQQAMELARNAIMASKGETKNAKAPAIKMEEESTSGRLSNGTHSRSSSSANPGGVAALADAAVAASKSNSSSSTPVTAAPPPPQAQPQSLSQVSQAQAPSSKSSSQKKGPPLRRGKWTAEEEAYANRLIQEFKAGLLPLTDGTTLRTFLSKLLNCDPMRISKKFVGSNCIGKQVFRRRTADINRLTPEQIQNSRAELSELERRFLERVAQTNRVKSNSGVGGSSSSTASKVKEENNADDKAPPSPPWLRVPNGYKAGATGGGSLGKSPAGSTNNRAAAAGRALLQSAGSGSTSTKPSIKRESSKPSLTSSRSHGSAGLLAMAEMHRRHSQQSLLQDVASGLAASNSANNLLNAAFAGGAGTSSGLSGQAMAQIARNASAARLAGLAASGHSMNNLMLKTGLSRDQLSQLARDQQLASSHSLSNMMERQSSFDALMSLDFQSLQSIDNLANLIQSGGGIPGHAPKTGMKNWSMDVNAGSAPGSSGNLAGLANARRLASEGRMESLIRTLSSGNVGSRGLGSGGSVGGGSNANFVNLLQNMQNRNSGNSLFGSGNQLSAASLANLLRADSATGLSALRMQDGLAQRNSSVDDFLSLVASGDIPHQDPHLLNVPLQSVLQQQQQAAAGQGSNGQSTGAQSAASYLAQQQLLAQAANKGNSALRLGNSASSLLNQFASSQGSSHVTNAAAAAFAQQQQQARAAQMNMSASALAAARASQNGSSGALKRKFMDEDDGQDSKR